MTDTATSGVQTEAPVEPIPAEPTVPTIPEAIDINQHVEAVRTILTVLQPLSMGDRIALTWYCANIMGMDAELSQA